jgi:hypothetical protein
LFSFPTGGSVSGGPVIAEGMAFVGVGLTTSQTETHGLFAFSP